ncbi:MAG: GGDEF domain-containing protein [Nitrosomonas sp.]|nr:MAG: GGDEF domain-containing protein [Nitrosomonas sp.]
MTDSALKLKLSTCQDLPSLPAVAIKIIELANDPDINIEAICQCISLDPALAAKLLRTANSPLYKTRRMATNIRQAVSILGTHTVLVISLSFSLVQSLMKKPLADHTTPFFDNNTFWRRSIATALAGHALGEKLGIKFLDDLFLAALVQEIGILAFWVLIPEEYSQVFNAASDHDTLLVAERENFGIGHDVLGYELLKKWQIPDYIALSCINSHCSPEPLGLGPTLQACLAVSRYLGDYFFSPSDPQKLMALHHAARVWLGIDGQVLIDVIDVMTEKLDSIENVFEIAIHDPSEANHLLAQAKELLVAHSLLSMKDLEDKSRHDGLTCAFNRAYFDETLASEFHLAVQNKSPLTVALIDIDHFKKINDTYGHVTGDSLLVILVESILKQIRHDDALSRYGGEEFALILPGTSLAASRNLMMRLKDVIAAISYRFDAERLIRITVSVGVAAYEANALGFKQPNDLIRAADAALYEAKHAGRNQIKEWREAQIY